MTQFNANKKASLSFILNLIFLHFKKFKMLKYYSFLKYVDFEYLYLCLNQNIAFPIFRNEIYSKY